MDAKSIRTLELPLVLARLSQFTSFSAGRARALESLPSSDFAAVALKQRQTTEARRLLSTRGDVSVGGARDVREAATAAALGTTLRAEDFLAIRQTVVAGRTLGRLIRRAEAEYPALAEVAAGLDDLPEIVDAIDRTPYDG